MSTAITVEHELVLMLDPEIPDERRDQIANEARQRIESGATLKNETAWGMRKLAYEIRQRTEADYRFFRFEAGGELLDDLSHSLRIADGVLRFRIFKVDPRSPAIVPPPPLSTSAAAQSRGPRRPQGGRGARSVADEAPAPAAPEAAEAPAEAPPPTDAGEAPPAEEQTAEAEAQQGSEPEPAE